MKTLMTIRKTKVEMIQSKSRKKRKREEGRMLCSKLMKMRKRIMVGSCLQKDIHNKTRFNHLNRTKKCLLSFKMMMKKKILSFLKRKLLNKKVSPLFPLFLLRNHFLKYNLHPLNCRHNKNKPINHLKLNKKSYGQMKKRRKKNQVL